MIQRWPNSLHRTPPRNAFKESATSKCPPREVGRRAGVVGGAGELHNRFFAAWIAGGNSLGRNQGEKRLDGNSGEI